MAIIENCFAWRVVLYILSERGESCMDLATQPFFQYFSAGDGRPHSPLSQIKQMKDDDSEMRRLSGEPSERDIQVSSHQKLAFRFLALRPLAPCFLDFSGISTTRVAACRTKCWPNRPTDSGRRWSEVFLSALLRIGASWRKTCLTKLPEITARLWRRPRVSPFWL